MERRDETDETAETNPMHMQPGALEDIETASAYANRTGQHDTTSLRPGRAQLGKQDQARADETSRSAENASDTTDNPLRTDGRTDPPEGASGLTSAADPMR